MVIKKLLGNPEQILDPRDELVGYELIKVFIFSEMRLGS